MCIDGSPTSGVCLSAAVAGLIFTVAVAVLLLYLAIAVVDTSLETLLPLNVITPRFAFTLNPVTVGLNEINAKSVTSSPSSSTA